ncbi:MAG: AMP-binding protein [Acidobacteriales bacterium]|nr:AMP-binding protein [Terriglobales bacterium]
MPAESLLDYFDTFVQRGRDCAYIQRRGYRTERWSYAEVADLAYRFARELAARDIRQGDRIALWGPNSAEWISAFFGAALAGVIVVPIDEIATAEFATRILEQVGAKLIVAPASRRQDVTDVPLVALEDLRSLLQHHSPSPHRPAAIHRTDTLEIVFTSGTTAEPKGVVITHANLLSNIQPLELEIRKYMKYERWVHPVRFLNLLPLSHVFGQFLGIFLPQLLRGTVIFSPTTKAREVIDTIRRERASVLVAVPHMLDLLKQSVEGDLRGEGRFADFQRRFESSKGKHYLRRWWIFRRIRRKFGWKFWALICGGAALALQTEEFWGRLGYAVVQGYGLTETTSIISVNHPFRLGTGSVGKVLAGREVKLGADNEILVRGGGVSSGYWSSGQMHPVADEQGWYATGDLGAFDDAGNLIFKGRKKQVIVTPAGMNVYPSDLEAALRRQPQVKDCVVIPVTAGGNEEACAVLILHTAESAATVVASANEELADYQRMRRWFVWPEPDFPRTSTQKPQLSAIRETVLAGALDDKRSDTLAALLSRFGAGLSPVPPQASLDSDLGLSSLDRVELLSALEQRYRIDLSDTNFAALRTVGDVQRALHGEAPPRPVFHYARWAQRWPVTWIRFVSNHLLLLPAIRILGRPRISGSENLRGVSGPLLVISNHIGDVDPGFILAALSSRLRRKLAIATRGETLESYRSAPPGTSWVRRVYNRIKWTLGAALLNLFPLPREAGFRESFAFAGDLVDRGYSVLVFPEGRHTDSGEMLPFRSGIGLLATQLGIPVLPLRIDGLFAVKRSGRRYARQHEITVTIGSPVSFDTGTPAEEVARDLQARVAALGRQHAPQKPAPGSDP